MTSEELFVFSMAGVIAFFFWLGRKRDKRRKAESGHGGTAGDFSGGDCGGGDGGGGCD
ncbi:hypothetical protein [Paracoccus methylarcula]|uniref:hypothetical protein n=1 Tax=Paracoccus methylarcula TaxID=72022 RepID=UPI001472FB30|nr:hypothetical protein [Paracoccus methylarcula]